MKIEFGDLAFDVDNVNEIGVAYSRLTLEKLHSFEAELEVTQNEIIRFEQLYEEYKDGEVVVSDEKLGIVKGKFKATLKNGLQDDSSKSKLYLIYFNECSNKSLKAVEFQGQCFEASKISQEISNSAVIINMKTIVTPEQFKMIYQLKCDKSKYFPVIRKGIDMEPLQMRFGRTLWCESEDVIKMSLVLIEEKYDKTADIFHGFAEPQLSNAIKRLEQLKNQTTQLLNILESNNLITVQQREEIERETDIKDQMKEYYRYERVNDIDEWE